MQNTDKTEHTVQEMPKIWQRLKDWANHLKNETVALYFAYKDPRTPWYAKAIAAFTVAHTFSPIDLIPDFIPVLGILDDLVITPLGLALSIRLIPADVMQDARREAAERVENGRIVSKAGLVMVIAIWVLVIAAISVVVYRLIKD